MAAAPTWHPQSLAAAKARAVERDEAVTAYAAAKAEVELSWLDWKDSPSQCRAMARAVHAAAVDRFDAAFDRLRELAC